MAAHIAVQPYSLFLPVYNEEVLLVSHTEKLLQYLPRLKNPFEVLIGSNGSTDSTPRLGEELAARNPLVRFFHLPKKGPGAAFRRAIELMRYDQLVCMDMDLSTSLDFVPTSLDLLAHHDIVIGSKKMGVESRGPLRRWGSNLYIATSKLLMGLPFDDYSLGAKAYRKPVLERYRGAIDRDTFYVQQIIYWAYRDGCKIIQVPIRCIDERKSRFNLIHEGFYRFGRIFRLWLSARLLGGRPA